MFQCLLSGKSKEPRRPTQEQTPGFCSLAESWQYDGPSATRTSQCTPRGCQEPGRGNSWSSSKAHPALSSSTSRIANACLPELAPSMLQRNTPRKKERLCQTFPAAQEWNMGLGQVPFLSCLQLIPTLCRKTPVKFCGFV